VLAAAIPVREPVITAAPRPAAGEQTRSGAALVGTGPGAGSGGSGPGGGGSGNGGGGARLGGTPAEWTGGEIKRSDYPKAAREAGLQGTTETEITVGEKGRATGCRVTRTSGSPLLDQTTCRLILRRFRFRPARDRYGRTIVDTIGYDQEWVFTRVDPE